MRALAFALLTVAACGGAPAPAPTNPTPATSASAAVDTAKSYPIHLSRPDRVGERTKIVYDVESTDHFRAVHQPDPGATEALYHLEATRTLLAVNDEGNTSAFKLVIDTLDQTKAGLKTTVATRGQEVEVVRAEESADATVTIDRAPAAKDVRDALDATVSLTVNHIRDDDVFGTVAPKKVGDSWPVDSDGAARGLSSIMKASQASGTLKLVAVTVVDGEECLEIEGTILVHGRLMKLGDGMRARPTDLSFTFRSFYPLDVTKHTVRDDVDIRVGVDAVMDGANGKTEVRGETRRHVRSRTLALP